MTTSLYAVDPEMDALIERALDQVDLLPPKLAWALLTHLRGIRRFAEAAAVLESVAARDGGPIKRLDEEARLAFASGDRERAHHLLLERIERSPAPTARVALARFLLECGDLPAASALAHELFAERPYLATVADLAIDVALAAGDAEFARGLLLTQVDVRPAAPVPLFKLARLSLDEADPDAASEFLRRGLAAGERPSAANLTTAAELARELGQSELADRLASEATAIATERQSSLATALREALAALPGGRSPVAHRAGANVPASVPAPERARGSRRAPERHTAVTVAATATTIDDERVTRALKTWFDYESLRPGQAAVMEHVLAGQDTLAIMPTGAGKSLTFQLPALLHEGVTLVVSPLIALMKDQVDSLPPVVRAKTALFNSSLTAGEMRDSLDRLARGEIKLAYAAPERLRQHRFLEALIAAHPSLVVIDEAHCISMWGHDFRPDYLYIPRALEQLGQPPVLAITATATPAMARQIGGALGRELNLVRTSVFRPNLRYEVIPCRDREARVASVVDICRRERGCGIVYVTSRRDTESIAAVLRDRGVTALPYHAGLDIQTRSDHQDRFMTGQARVMVATIAFGMGVNKADVRFLIHANPPRSLEAYAQESGRAGRDGAPARCVLLAGSRDRTQLMTMVRRDQLDIAVLRTVYAAAKRAARGSWAIVEIGALTAGLDDEVSARVGLSLLEQAGLIRRHPDAPRTISLRFVRPSAPANGQAVEPEPLWIALKRWMGEEMLRREVAIIDCAAAAAGTGAAPADLLLALEATSAVEVREGDRAICLEIPPPPANSAARLDELLNQARLDAERRVRDVIDYATGSRCRHVALASHLGEDLAPCGTSCDICLGTAARTVVDPAVERTTLTATDVQAVLDAVGTLPFPMGKPGLIKLLSGSTESRIRGDRSRQFGALAGVKRSRIDRLLDRLIDSGLLVWHLEHEFKIITLPERGARPSREELEAIAQEVPKRASPIQIGDDLEPAERRLLDRLTAWRRNEASRQSVPPYVVAHNNTLLSLAAARPGTRAGLLAVRGLGPERVDRYGDELLRLIAADD